MKFTEQRLQNIRRMRKARRFWRYTPLFAFVTMCQLFPGYTEAAFVDDLRVRRKAKAKRKKSPLARYGRYWRMLEMAGKFMQTGEIEYWLKALQLRKFMTKPYQIIVHLKGWGKRFTLPPTVNIASVERLTQQMGRCADINEASLLFDQLDTLP